MRRFLLRRVERGMPRPLLDPSTLGTSRESLWSLLYRYWFWSWLFENAALNDWYGQMAALRHNCAQRHHLPVYMRRWLTCAGLWLAVGWLLETQLLAPITFATAYTFAVLALTALFLSTTGW